MTAISLCPRCRWCRVIQTPKGSRFYLCQLSQADSQFPKYPAQPVWQCVGYEPTDAENGSGNDTVARVSPVL